MVNSSKLEWEIFPQLSAGPDDCQTIYCADGDGFVSVEAYAGNFYVLSDQGDPVADIEGKTRAEVLEIAQNYLAATYPAVFKMWEIANA
jgi:hypothetical protein